MTDIEGHRNELFHVIEGGEVMHRYRYEDGDPFLGDMSADDARRAFGEHLGVHRIERELAPFQELTEWLGGLVRRNQNPPFGQIMTVDEDSDGMVITVLYPDGRTRDWVITINDL